AAAAPVAGAACAAFAGAEAAGATEAAGAAALPDAPPGLCAKAGTAIKNEAPTPTASILISRIER
ncbi:hypothetical protein BE21_07615, partial [Sorangium cellulosum]